MKIAMFTDVFLEVPGGIGSSIAAAKKALEDLGHEVVVYCPGWHPERDRSVITVPTMRSFRPNGAPWAHKPKVVTEWILQEHPEIREFDVIHAHYEGPVSLAAAEIAKKCGIPLVQTLHGREDQAISHNIPKLVQKPVARLLGALQRKTLRRLGAKQAKIAVNEQNGLVSDRQKADMWQIMLSQGALADLVITPAEHMAKKLKSLGLKTPLEVLPNGIQEEIVPLQPQLRVWREGEPLKISWNSRLSHEKRFLPLLEALKIAGEDGLNYELTAFGGGNQMKAAKKYIETNSLNVKLRGSVGRTEALRGITRAHLSTITSYNFDVHSLTLVEAEACGTPLLICDPDMVESLPENSFVISKTPEPADIARALLELADNRDKISQMSRVMLAHRHEVYQSARSEQLVKIYNKVIKEANGRK